MARVVAFRTDASRAIGSGHVMRCLALADALLDGGLETHFLCRAHAGHQGGLIVSRGHRLHLLPDAPADAAATGHATWLGTDWRTDAAQSGEILEGLRPGWLVVDHYALDARWESAQRAHADHILAIDDLADRDHDCDLLLDQNFHADGELRYKGRLPAPCRLLAGPRYALLRPEFSTARHSLRPRNGEVKRILVCFGGGDAPNLSGRTLDAIASLKRPDIAVDLVAGPLHPCRQALEAACAARPGTTFHAGTERMAELMAAADLAVGAGGGMNWERASLGLPSLVLALADNQRPGVQALAEAGLILGLAEGESAGVDDIVACLAAALLSPALLRGMSKRTAELVDGKGAERLARRLTEPEFRFRLAAEEDCMNLFRWRNHPEIRANSLQTAPIDEIAHRAWFRRTLADPQRMLLLAEDECPAAVLRFDLSAAPADHSALISIYLVPERLHRGIGSAVLRQGIAWLRRQRPDIGTIVAEVRPHNRASLEAFRGAGFTEEKFVLIHEK